MHERHRRDTGLKLFDNIAQWWTEITILDVELFVTLWTVVFQTLLSMGFSRQEY